MTSTTRSSGKEESSEQEGHLPDKEKESADIEKETSDKKKGPSYKKEESSDTEEESKPSKWTTMPVIGFLLALNTTWLIWPRVKALGGKYKLLYLVVCDCLE